MTLEQTTEEKIYERLRAFDGIELGGNAPVTGSIASVLAEGEVLADTGEQYDSIQDAVDASDSWTFIGPGTYYENVVIRKEGFHLQGAGYDTNISGGTVSNAIVTEDRRIEISSLRANADGYNTIQINDDNNTIQNVTIETGFHAVAVTGDSCTIDSCDISAGSSGGLYLDGGTGRNIIVNNEIYSTNITGDGISVYSDNNIVANNHLYDIDNDGIELYGVSGEESNDNIIIGNRIQNCTSDGIILNGAIDNIIANNRVSDCGTDINDFSSTSTLFDSNLTGVSN